MDTTCDLILTGENTGDVFGWRMDASGDIDGDNYCDLITGTRFWPKTAPEGEDAIGRAYLYYGGNPMDGNCDVIFTGENINDQFGVSLDLDDVDNDGLADIFIAARGYNKFRGRVYLYWGKPKANMNNIVDVTFSGEGGNEAFGGDDIEVGHVNDDDYGDIVVNAYGWLDSDCRGRAYLFYGNTKTHMDTNCDLNFTGHEPQSARMHSTIGDFNNDSYGDSAIGGWRWNNAQGRVWLYYGGPGDSTQLKFHWDTTNASPGKHILKATIAPVEGEKDTADNMMTVEVEIKEHPKSTSKE
jgi:hypothetical protein